jgi:uncharacterized protein (TIGR02246 family)
MDSGRYERWVERYVKAWNTNDPEDIKALFADDARYQTEPYAAPWQGIDEIVSGWLAAKDEPGDTKFHYSVLVATDDLGIVKGDTAYKSTGRKYSNLWEIRLDDSDTCTEFVEWWMEKK